MDLLVYRPTQAYGVRGHHASWQMQTKPGRPLSSIEVNALEATQLQKVSTMPNAKCINNGHNSKDNHLQGLGVQALKATQVQKKPVTSNARTRKQNAPADENIDPRRSARLNTAPKSNLNDTVQQSPNTVNASQALATTERPGAKPKNRHKLTSAPLADEASVTRSTPRDDDARLQGAGLLGEIQDLQRQLREEKGKSTS
jgi:hypothetical protein